MTRVEHPVLSSRSDLRSSGGSGGHGGGCRGAPIASFKSLYESMAPRLQAVFRTRGDVLVATGSATLVMESAIISTVESRVLNLVCGAFSERWHQICLSLGKQADRVSVPWGRGRGSGSGERGLCVGSDTRR